jgi:regulator of replication initiation timing
MSCVVPVSANRWKILARLRRQVAELQEENATLRKEMADLKAALA